VLLRDPQEPSWSVSGMARVVPSKTVR